jgi:hypothetical protein
VGYPWHNLNGYPQGNGVYRPTNNNPIHANLPLAARATIFE